VTELDCSVSSRTQPVALSPSGAWRRSLPELPFRSWRIPFATSIVTVLGPPSRAGTATRADRRPSRLYVRRAAHRQTVRPGAVGCCAGGWTSDGRNAPDPDVSPTGRDRWWLLTTCPGVSSSRRSALVQFCSHCSPSPGTPRLREAPTGATRGPQWGGEARDVGQSALVPNIAKEGRTSDGRNRICELKAGEATNRPWSREPEKA
jgi:hypothetical protein